MTARQIEKLLADRHSKDIFVPQCKNGPTHISTSLQILDGWAMSRSWAHPKYTGYEIKVSRQDFLRDDKWRQALALCNEFYWVAPKDTIDVSEIAPECGLLVVSSTGNRLFVKRRAQYRDVEPPIDLLRYILMCRTHIKNETVKRSEIDKWRDWLVTRDEKKEIGLNVSNKIQELVYSRITSVNSENKELRRQIELFEEAREILRSLGLLYVRESKNGNIEALNGWNLRGQIKKALSPLPANIVESLKETASMLDIVSKSIAAKEHQMEIAE